MAWTDADLTKVRKAIASGALTIRYADRTVTYRSLEDLRSIEREIATALGQPTTPRRRLAETKDGL